MYPLEAKVCIPQKRWHPVNAMFLRRWSTAPILPAYTVCCTQHKSHHKLVTLITSAGKREIKKHAHTHIRTHTNIHIHMYKYIYICSGSGLHDASSLTSQQHSRSPLEKPRFWLVLRVVYEPTYVFLYAPCTNMRCLLFYCSIVNCTMVYVCRYKFSLYNSLCFFCNEQVYYP